MKIFSFVHATRLLATMLCALLLSSTIIPAEDKLAAPANVPEPLSLTPVADNMSDPMVNLSYINVEVRDLLKLLSERTKMKIIVGDGVRNHVKMNVAPMRLSHLLNMLGTTANFAWDRVGNDTIIVVPKPAVPFFTMPTAPQLTPRVAPPPNRFVVPGLPAPQGPDPNWRGFEFNGSTIYVVPLQTPQLAAPVTTLPAQSEPTLLTK